MNGYDLDVKPIKFTELKNHTLFNAPIQQHIQRSIHFRLNRKNGPWTTDVQPN